MRKTIIPFLLAFAFSATPHNLVASQEGRAFVEEMNDSPNMEQKKEKKRGKHRGFATLQEREERLEILAPLAIQELKKFGSTSGVEVPKIRARRLRTMLHIIMMKMRIGRGLSRKERRSITEAIMSTFGVESQKGSGTMPLDVTSVAEHLYQLSNNHAKLEGIFSEKTNDIGKKNVFIRKVSPALAALSVALVRAAEKAMIFGDTEVTRTQLRDAFGYYSGMRMLSRRGKKGARKKGQNNGQGNGQGQGQGQGKDSGENSE